MLIQAVEISNGLSGLKKKKSTEHKVSQKYLLN